MPKVGDVIENKINGWQWIVLDKRSDQNTILIRTLNRNPEEIIWIHYWDVVWNIKDQIGGY